jgi:hypothetical protein
MFYPIACQLHIKGGGGLGSPLLVGDFWSSTFSGLWIPTAYVIGDANGLLEMIVNSPS